ncbi:hypothetical protein D1872_318390 [compost metagenome]
MLDCAYRQIVQTLNASKGHWTAEELLSIVDRLNGQTPFEAQYIGLSLLQVAGKALLWNQSSADRLRAYRKHEHEIIRMVAMDMWTVLE